MLQLVKHGESKMFDYVSLDKESGTVIFNWNSRTMQLNAINNGATGSAHGILCKSSKTPLNEFLHIYNKLDKKTRKAIDNFANTEPALFNKLINLQGVC